MVIPTIDQPKTCMFRVLFATLLDKIIVPLQVDSTIYPLVLPILI